MQPQTLIRLLKASIFKAALLSFILSMLISGVLTFAALFFLVEDFSLQALVSYEMSIFSVPLFLLFFSLMFWLITRTDVENAVEEKLLEPLNDLSLQISNLRVMGHLEQPEQHYDLAEVQQIYDLMAGHIRSFHMVYEHLDVLNVTDHTTGLFSRQYFYEVVKHESYMAQRYQRPFSILIIQLRYISHPTLSEREQLTRFGQILINNVRHADMVFHITDKVFILLTPETDQSQAEHLVKDFGERILQAKKTILDFKLDFQIGTATYGDEDGTHVDELIQSAKKRMTKVELS